MIYIFHYKSDTKCEPIGRVMATSLDEAREMISEIKALSEDIIDELGSSVALRILLKIIQFLRKMKTYLQIQIESM